MIGKGVISSVNGSTATVVPSFSDAPVSAPLTIPFFLVGGLSAGVPVVYAQFEDNTGLILARMDGGWSKSIPTGVTVSGVVNATDVSTGSVASLNTHQHTADGHPTSIPNG